MKLKRFGLLKYIIIYLIKKYFNFFLFVLKKSLQKIFIFFNNLQKN
jgi:hypothetical protein